MGVERMVVAAAEVAERVAPGVGERLLAEVANESPSLARLLGINAAQLNRAAEAEAAASKLARASRLPRQLSEAEEDAHMERLLKAIDDRSVGLPPKELVNEGLGARLWQFGTAGGDVIRERAASEATGKWSPELVRSRDWLKGNPQAYNRVLSEREPVGRVQTVHQGVSTQFAAGPLEVGLRTDNVATCAAIYCRDGARQFLGHADGMVHHRAVSEALSTAGIDLNSAHVTLMPGPLQSPVLETIMPAFMENPNTMARLRIIPFHGPAHGSIIAKDGSLFVPKK